MRMSTLVGKRTRETPRDAQSPSHVFLLRGGYIRPFSTGIYGLLPLARRITLKIEKIIREEMNHIGGQEVLMPIVLPRELWEESGRYQTIGPELLRFKDRNDKDMLLGMTHEEAVVHMVRNDITSYKQLPLILYQVNTKYRDEARARGGLLRVREFTMKDAYSFHASEEDLKKKYQECLEAYERIFKRVGLRDCVVIESDSGMMGGAVSHEFMALAECGEDTIFMTEDRQYLANREIAKTALKFKKEPPKPLTKIPTPGKKSIEEVAAFLKVSPEYTAKAVFYMAKSQGLILAVIRGDIEVNEVKLKNHLKSPDLRFASDEEIRSAGCVPGYASPLGVDTRKCRVIFDRSAAESSNLVVGANEEGFHFSGFNFEREMAGASVEVTDIATAREGDPAPEGRGALQGKRGIEVGNIFQLGTKYSESMGCHFLDENGKSKPMIMGCYGIGVGRTMAAVLEQNHDQYGPIWPPGIAPFEVHICALNRKQRDVFEASEKIYHQLTTQGIETLLDDRDENAGVVFNDADLIGVPLRLIIAPRSLAEGKVEFKMRDGTEKAMIPVHEVQEFAEKALKRLRGENVH